MAFRQMNRGWISVGLVLVLWISVVPHLRGAPSPPSPPHENSRDVQFSLRSPKGEATPSLPSGMFTLSLSRPEGLGPTSDTAADTNLEMKKKWGRTTLELGSFLLYSTVRYWLKYSDFIEDWQYELTWEDQKRRFFTTEALRFDSNCFQYNWTHGIAGALYYQLARTNYLTWLESTFMAFMGSLWYEYVGEFREVISLSDMIVTSLGAYSLGEPWFQLGDYLSHQSSLILKGLSFLNPILKFNRWLDRKHPASKVFQEPGWHSFEIFSGARRFSTAGAAAWYGGYIGFHTQIINPSEYGKPGKVRKTVHHILFSEIAFDMALRGKRPGDIEARGGWDEETRFFTRVVNWARYWQNINELSRGHAFSLGLGSAFRYMRKRPVLYDSDEVKVRLDPPPPQPVDFRDKFAIIHALGPVADWTYFGRHVKFRAQADAYLDFALVNAYALNEYSRQHDISGMKTTLVYYGYHYAAGFSASCRADVEWRGFEGRARVSYHLWDSIEGLDRFQADILDDNSVKDSLTQFLFGAAWHLPGVPLKIFLNFEGVRRWGRMKEIEVSRLEKRTYAGLRFLF